MTKMTPARLAITGLMLTVLGLIGLVPILFNSEEPALAASQTPTVVAPAPTQTQAAAEEVAAPQTISGDPVRVEAPTVGVNMPVVDGGYDASTGQWTLNDNKAQFATMTTKPNDKNGQTFIYGHATQQVFGKLLNMKIGAEAHVFTDNGYKFTYTLKSTEVVDPHNTGILAYTGSPRLLLQTCVGTFSENRKFFILDFTKVEKV